MKWKSKTASVLLASTFPAVQLPSAAELDPAGKEQLFSTLHARGGQIFAATAEPISPAVPCAVYRISSGKIDKIEEKV